MNVIVVGCGRLGAELAYHLSQRGHEVTVIDYVAAAFDNLRPDFRGRTVEGEVLNQDVLRRAGIEQAHALAAVTNSDSLNVVAAHVARTVFQIPYVVCRNYNPRWRPLHEAFGLQFVSSTTWGAQRIEALLSQSEMHPVWAAGDGAVETYEFVAPATWQGRTLQEVLPEGECVAVALIRADQTILPTGDTRVEKGDVLYLSATPEGREVLRRWLESAQGA
jgi:trk system potassium uptake protein TrkA